MHMDFHKQALRPGTRAACRARKGPVMRVIVSAFIGVIREQRRRHRSAAGVTVPPRDALRRLAHSKKPPQAVLN